mmetsp:Transcript_50132/g.76231  ORF Transcript_50132/g.76231 Transcript_50132/m.76231 type:complete len:298 (+) Transcript_50132:122-1015(+)|eukprot:CAMPEP_0117030836 /NCGR_PEP_ID=MMETSP0472-20121206/22227_1 /TAXON_ID=693140 ORGANISM="Tiarina fusus, Strain LIS" /NCGR_SAMPLE_ID=MMETSP0472 /ASSEMBLY_ACC=CAM_ASM_000603 /LENGTH=297 /DNA_ID=CAMNT_0004739025 /DNA_START=121 /DNA_END=1014 /DNA_ORIENTATION=-
MDATKENMTQTLAKEVTGNKTQNADKDAETSGSSTSSEPSKRFIPEHKKPDAALTFPEKMMSLMKFAVEQDEETYCVAWLPDGKSFVIRNPDEFTRQVLPKYFKATKFSSFTRKLYRWGFRQVNRGIGPDDPIIFGNEFFQRDNLVLMTKMRSITAASTRKQEQVDMRGMAQKRALDVMEADHRENNKRVLLDQIMQQKAFNMHNQAAMFGQNGGMNLTNALRPNLVGNGGFGGINGLKPFDMFGQNLQSSNPLMGAFQMQQPTNMANIPSSNPQFSNTASTVDIVNAAISALRYAP